MNRLLTILGMASLLFFHTSCNDSIMELKSHAAETRTLAVDKKVSALIQQARKGDAEAYKSLALCYKDGDGVEKSWFNMMCMYLAYCDRTGQDLEEIIKTFDADDIYMVISDIVDASSIDENVNARLEQLKQMSPAEAMAVEAAREAILSKDRASAMSLMREAEDEGSEMAGIYQVAYYKETNDTVALTECLLRIADKYPFYYLFLGDIYADKYQETNDLSYIKRAIECYYNADEYGMLVPKYAYILYRIYNNFVKDGLLQYDEQEMERLKRLAGRI